MNVARRVPRKQLIGSERRMPGDRLWAHLAYPAPAAKCRLQPAPPLCVKHDVNRCVEAGAADRLVRRRRVPISSFSVAWPLAMAAGSDQPQPGARITVGDPYLTELGGQSCYRAARASPIPLQSHA